MPQTRLEQRSGRLPAEFTSFVGRRAELAEIPRLLQRSRLVTLTGPGGVGKTRLAVRAAVRVAESFDDGVRFVDLSALREPGLLARTVGDAFGLPDQGGSRELDTLVAHLSDRRLLLLIDTCEHLVDACAMLVELLLSNAPSLHVLVTSRQPLDIAGEHTVMVAPLTRPGERGDDPERPCDSVSLFAERAMAVVQGWNLTEHNHEAVARLCRRLDGIPLAIELAAVQLRALSEEQILDLLERRMLPIRGRRTIMPRHQTLRAAIDWSHELCSDGERLLWARLSVFAGDFDLRAAEEVCADDALPAAEIIERITGLVAKSIVLRVDRDGAARYRMLDTVREYGAERLEARGETAGTRARAFHWYAEMIERARAELGGDGQPRWLAWFRREQANVRAAVEYGLQTTEYDLLVRATLGLGRIFALHGMIGEARLWATRVIQIKGIFADGEGTPDAARTEALALIGLLAAMQNDLDDAAEWLRWARERADAADDQCGLAYIQGVEGVVALYADEPARSVSLLAESVRLHREAGTDDVLVPIFHVFLATAATLGGDPAAGERHAIEAIAITEPAGELWSRSYGLCLRGLALVLKGDPQGALPEILEGLRVKRDLNDQLGMALALDMLALCRVALGDAEGGARLQGAAETARRSTEVSMFGSHHRLLREVYAAEATLRLGEIGYQAAYEAGLRWDADDAVASALGERPPADDDEPPAEPGEAARVLTRREIEIAGLVAEGMTNREIADRLVIAKRTVDSHLEHILAKLGFTSRTQIAAWYARRG
ncbi:ATP-binding protein [Spirillospora sp. CA-294931]|uniref:ATP-binding protein n=1 Tax=Spirillospora sp. CA-294931 TaxID=3240042 RepID=UPI003D8CC09A